MLNGELEDHEGKGRAVTKLGQSEMSLLWKTVLASALLVSVTSAFCLGDLRVRCSVFCDQASTKRLGDYHYSMDHER